MTTKQKGNLTELQCISAFISEGYNVSIPFGEDTRYDFIADDGYLGLGEDKQLGPFFIEFDTTATPADHKKQVKNKLLHYLWSDVHKASYKSDVKLFKDDLSTFKKLYEAFERDEQIFSTDFLNTL